MQPNVDVFGPVRTCTSSSWYWFVWLLGRRLALLSIFELPASAMAADFFNCRNTFRILLVFLLPSPTETRRLFLSLSAITKVTRTRGYSVTHVSLSHCFAAQVASSRRSSKLTKTKQQHEKQPPSKEPIYHHLTARRYWYQQRRRPPSNPPTPSRRMASSTSCAAWTLLDDLNAEMASAHASPATSWKKEKKPQLLPDLILRWLFAFNSRLFAKHCFVTRRSLFASWLALTWLFRFFLTAAVSAWQFETIISYAAGRSDWLQTLIIIKLITRPSFFFDLTIGKRVNIDKKSKFLT